ncbi:hypothetical protein JOF42_003533 [Microbacterium phyllosphaerae]|uniref:DUF1707 domain-containing protein n=1 Tax=Microbacterium phyllosphaerae TaxID=124798 RepID=A0ABS4WUZ9_9MICO|nr:hypothetical protein [Microbacterium phyllosphaerae]MBP2380038.1 hypothetical protein [Microbacterium phyllosphaerae]
MSGTRDDYGTALADELELRDVPSDQVDLIVREVRSHLAESGEDPLETFGSPEHYADQFAPRSWTRRMLWGLVALAGLLGAGAGLLLLSGVFGLMDPSMQLWGWAPSIRLTLGTLCLLGLAGLLTFMVMESRRRQASWTLRR